MNKRRRGKKRRKKQRTVSWRIESLDRELAAIRETIDERSTVSFARLGRLKEAMETHLDRSGLTLEPDLGSESIVFRRGREAVAYLFRDELVAAHGGRSRFSADFGEPGPHWSVARDFLLALQQGHEPGADQTLVLLCCERFPGEMSSALAELGLAASARLRTHRHYAFRNVMKLRAEGLVLTFAPTRYRAGGVEVPFRLEQSGGTAVDAALRLAGTDDPLAIAFPADVDGAAVLEAWPIALAGFADLTCVETAEPYGFRPKDADGPPRDKDPEIQVRRCRTIPARRSRGPRGVKWSSRLSPVGTIRQSPASFVAGHRRNLPPGKHCSEEALAMARSFGIRLGPGETWVQPHERGMAGDVVGEFAWRLPARLAEQFSGVTADHGAARELNEGLGV